MDSNNKKALLYLQDISLKFKEKVILDKINLKINESEVHAIVGEHGAGKSSLCYIISGLLIPNSGNITFNHTSQHSLTQTRANQLGIELVPQNTATLNNLTVAENLFINKKIANTFTLFQKEKYFLAADSYLRKYGFDIDSSEYLANLNTSDQAVVDVLKHIYSKPKLLILDEALVKLSASTLQKMLKVISDEKKRGTSIIFVTHRIDDIYNIADKVSVIKNGEILITDSVENIDKINLIKIAYTQITNKGGDDDFTKEFYQLLKYNEAILKRLPVNLIVIDREEKIKLINEYARQYFKIDEKPFSYNTPLKEIFKKGNQVVLNKIHEAIQENLTKIYYNVPIIFAGETTVNIIKTYPIFDGSALIGNIIIIEDVTEQEKLREQVNLSEKLASIGLLAAGVAHEINNPLEIIYNYISRLKRNTSNTKNSNTLKNLEEEINSIALIVSNLIAFSSDSKRIGDTLEPNENIFELDTVLSTILNLIKHTARDKKIKIGYFPESVKMPIKANKTEIKQLILNLIKNSFEAMPDGGELVIRTRELWHGGSREIEIIFVDTGCGIQENNPHDILLPFYSTKNGKGHNLGLGLSVSYGIIKRYNGSITYRNLEKSGCEFKITIPQTNT